MKTFVLFAIAVALISGCAAYPRYTNYSDHTPVSRGPSVESMDTEGWLRMGTILQSYLGKPYGDRRSRDLGLDCSLFIKEVYWKFNRTRLPRKSSDQYEVGRGVPARRLYYGDLLFFETERNRVSHVGLYIGNNEIIHVTASEGVIITNLSEKYWAKRFVGARRILGVESNSK